MILTIRAEKADIDAFSKGEGFWRLPRANPGHHPLKETLVLFPDGGLAVVLENPLPYGGEGVNKAGVRVIAYFSIRITTSILGVSIGENCK